MGGVDALGGIGALAGVDALTGGGALGGVDSLAGVGALGGVDDLAGAATTAGGGCRRGEGIALAGRLFIASSLLRCDVSTTIRKVR